MEMTSELFNSIINTSQDCVFWKDKETKGYLVCAVKRSLRIWQENECAILFYLSELLN